MTLKQLRQHGQRLRDNPAPELKGWHRDLTRTYMAAIYYIALLAVNLAQHYTTKIKAELHG